MKEETSNFVLKKETVIQCLHDIIGNAFCSYEGDNKKFDDISLLEDNDLLLISDEDWGYISIPWNFLKGMKDSFYEILNQTPKHWFKEK